MVALGKAIVPRQLTASVREGDRGIFLISSFRRKKKKPCEEGERKGSSSLNSQQVTIFGGGMSPCIAYCLLLEQLWHEGTINCLSMDAADGKNVITRAADERLHLEQEVISRTPSLNSTVSTSPLYDTYDISNIFLLKK